MNRFEFLGRITQEPTIRNTQNGGVVYSNSIAVERKYKRDNEPNADFFNITSFGKTAEFMQKYMNIKGTRILVEGHIQNRTWEDQNGQKRYATNFIVDSCYFADSKKEAAEEQHGEAWEDPKATIASDDDLPF